MLSLDVEPATSPIAEILGVPPGADISVLVRLRSAAGLPIARMCNYIPHTIPGLAEAPGP